MIGTELKPTTSKLISERSVTEPTGWSHTGTRLWVWVLFQPLKISDFTFIPVGLFLGNFGVKRCSHTGIQHDKYNKESCEC